MGPTITWEKIKTACGLLVKDQYGHDSPIQCIKEVRAFTNKGLKEAKDLVDAVRSEYIPNGTKGADAASIYASAMRDRLLEEGYLILATPGEGSGSIGSQAWVHSTTSPTSEVEMSVTATIHRHMTAQSIMIGRLLEAMEEQNELLKDLVEAVSE